MEDSQESNEPDAPKSIWLKLSGVFRSGMKSVLGESVSWITKAIVFLLVSSAAIVWYNSLDAFRDWRADSNNLEHRQAMVEAKRHIGANVLKAIPFRNRQDDTQYIAVWHQRYFSDFCDIDRLDGWLSLLMDVEAIACDDERLLTRLSVLIGSEGRFTIYHTDNVLFGPDFVGDLDDAYADDSIASIVDWNGDGNKEILTVFPIQATTGETIIYSLYSSNNLSKSPNAFLVQSSFPPSTKYQFSEPIIPELRQWLLQMSADPYPLSQCRRKPNRVMQCNLSGVTQTDQEVDALNPQLNIKYDFTAHMENEWVKNNGLDFQVGPIHLTEFDYQYLVETGECAFSEANRTWIFSGKSIYLRNDDTNTSSLAYFADTYKFMPPPIFGREYIWLGLHRGEGLIAINRKSLTAKEFEVQNWGSNSSETLEILGQRSSGDVAEILIGLDGDSISVKGESKLVFADLKPKWLESEFSDSTVCYWPK